MDVAVDAQSQHAPAKVNLALHVVGQRPDGYHLIESLSVFTAFGDRIVVTPGDQDDLFVSGPFAHHVPLGSANLVLRARDAFRGRVPQAAAQPVAIALQKNIPVTAGVGGGSSDAAATLRALSRLFEITDGAAMLRDLALGIGADVPMCLEARPLVARGIGEIIEPVEKLQRLHLVLVNSGVAVETPRVFSALESKHNRPLQAVPVGMDFGAALTWLRSTRNDLGPPAVALAPEIGDVLAALEAVGAEFSRMSGSGATCFGLFPDAETAAQAAEGIRLRKPGWFVATTHTRD